MSDLTNFDFNFSKKLYFVENDKKVPKMGFEEKKVDNFDTDSTVESSKKLPRLACF